MTAGTLGGKGGIAPIFAFSETLFPETSGPIPSNISRDFESANSQEQTSGLADIESALPPIADIIGDGARVCL